jgi:hypothetical protein
VASSREDTTVRGVPGAFFGNGERLEIQTETTTLVIFASGRGQALRVAASLRGLNGGVGAGSLYQRPQPVRSRGSWPAKGSYSLGDDAFGCPLLTDPLQQWP